MENYNSYKAILLGEKIGSGCFRDVYECKLNDKYVVKVMRDDAIDTFANVIEWKIWEEIQDYKTMSKWFAPCEFITDDGKVLIQHKVRIRDIEKYPKKVPTFFTDIKQDNFGFIGKQLVCFDYNTTILTKNWNAKTLKNANF